jgi:hypothetical protein
MSDPATAIANRLSPIAYRLSPTCCCLKIKSILRSLEARTVSDLITAIGQALARITPKDGPAA